MRIKGLARLYRMNFNENGPLNRLCLRTGGIDAVLYLRKQELNFFGHDENTDSVNRGNLKKLSLLIERGPLETKNHCEKIKNWRLENYGHLRNQIRKSKFFGSKWLSPMT